MPSTFFTIVNNQLNYTFTPLPNITTYDFVVIGGGGGGGIFNGLIEPIDSGGNGAVVKTTYTDITMPLVISIGGGGGYGGFGNRQNGGGGGGYSKVLSNQVNIIAGGGGGGYHGIGGSGGMSTSGNGEDGKGINPGKGAVGRIPGMGNKGNNGIGVNGGGGGGILRGQNGNAPNGGNGGNDLLPNYGFGGNSTNGGNGGNGGDSYAGGMNAGGGGAGGGAGGGSANQVPIYVGAGGGGGLAGGGGGYGGGGAGSSIALNGINTVFSSAPYGNLTYGKGGVGANTNTNVGPTAGIQGYVLISWEDTPMPIPIANICFPAGTPVQTDQGLINIEAIDTHLHTIHSQPILHITRTTTLDKYLISFEKNSLNCNCPSQKTVMTKDHKIEFAGRMVSAYRFLDFSDQVKKVKYSGETLYNILLANHGTINVNNLTCETLHPENIIAKLYKANYNDVERATLIYNLNTSLQNKDVGSYKELLNQLKYKQ